MEKLTLQQVEKDILAEFPEFKLVPKADSRLMKVANVLLLIITFGQMKSFMTKFTTTMGYTVFTPYNWGQRSDRSRVVTLMHERIHMRQRQKYGMLLFGFLYLFVAFPIGLAYFRMKFEKEAYEESLRVTALVAGVELLLTHAHRESYIQHFTTAQYFWMWPFRGSIGRWYDETVARLVEP